MRITSINIGQLQPLGRGKSGIFKNPVEGPVQLEALGLVGDEIANAEHHGGPDQSLYAYSLQDYAWWSQQLERPLPAATFGENLTLSKFPPEPLRVGDIWSLGQVQLQVTAPRIPCAKLATRMGVTGMVKQFVQAERPGVYLRVLSTGLLQLGQPLQYQPADQQQPSILEIFRLYYQKERDPQQLQKVLTSQAAQRVKAACKRWLAAGRPNE